MWPRQKAQVSSGLIALARWSGGGSSTSEGVWIGIGEGAGFVGAGVGGSRAPPEPYR
jgi:hypothetical protein